MTHLFSPFTLRGVTFRNRIGVSPMCQYSSTDGFAGEWHLVHLGARAAGGVGLVIVEATAVEARGRITPHDLGIWQDDHLYGLSKIARFIQSQGAAAGIQIAHAGRKAGTARPWEGGKPVLLHQGGWIPVGPGDVPFNDGYYKPHALTADEVQQVCHAFVSAARRVQAAGFDVVEVHAAHGYLLHSFLSPLTNQRTDDYGGSLENRARLLLEIVRAIRAFWEKPLFVRISATDWVEGGWTVEDSVQLGGLLRDAGVDLVDCSSGGAIPGVQIPTAPGYQVPLAQRVREGAAVATAAVGLITEPAQADAIIKERQADMVLIGRAMLRDPHWAVNAAKALDQPIPFAQPYHRAY
ncbi:MAG: NADH:flavin oxidoreductase/NADH oxidase [Anaerolineae bacterium]|nr:NADH:flavin oxidoreductase/NADH oxidase [Anaerolineae bacterium]NUQ04293.1 NADH:flavin oxidoreductase/NADH oxidase [Anaerolineae bacterium]